LWWKNWPLPSYLKHLPTYLQPGTHTGHMAQKCDQQTHSSNSILAIGHILYTECMRCSQKSQVTRLKLRPKAYLVAVVPMLNLRQTGYTVCLCEL